MPGSTRRIGVAPGPANGFTLDLIDCFERFGDRIDWAMVILNPLEPWPGELCLDAAARHDINVITRVVDYGGLFYDDLTPGAQLGRQDHRSFRPQGWIEAGRGRIERMRPIADRAGLTMIQLACQWNLAHEAVQDRRADTRTGGRSGRASGRGQARRACEPAGRAAAHAPRTSTRSARSATTPARWR